MTVNFLPHFLIPVTLPQHQRRFC